MSKTRVVLAGPCPYVPTHTPAWAGQLTSYDFDDDRPVDITFESAEFEPTSRALFYSAFYSWEGPSNQYLVVYTEHHGYLTFLPGSVANVTGPTRKTVHPRSQKYWKNHS